MTFAMTWTFVVGSGSQAVDTDSFQAPSLPLIFKRNINIAC